MSQDPKQPGSPESYVKLTGKAAAPRPTLGLKKAPVYLVIVIAVCCVAFSVLRACTPGNTVKAALKDNKRPAFLGDAVRGLPNDYSGIKRPTPGVPLLPFAAAPQRSGQTAPRDIQNELQQARLKQAAAAHLADVGFSGVTLPKSTRDSNAGSFAPGAPGGASEPYAQSPRDEDNRQDDKAAFLSSAHRDNPYLQSTLLSPISPYQLMSGSIIPGVLLTGINSDLPGQITGQVSQNIFDSVRGRHLLVPQGTKVIGEYDSRVSYGQERVLIIWARLIFPNGRSLSLEGMPGIDLSGYAGLHERVNNHYTRLLTGVVFGSLLGAGAQMAHGSNRNVDPTFDQLALEGTAQNINQAGQQITRKNLNLQPTLEISPGQRFNVFVTKDLILEPYKP